MLSSVFQDPGPTTEPILNLDPSEPDLTIRSLAPVVDPSLQQARDQWMRMLAPEAGSVDGPIWNMEPDTEPTPIRRPRRWAALIRFGLATAILGSTAGYLAANRWVSGSAAEPEAEPEITVTWSTPQPERKISRSRNKLQRVVRARSKPRLAKRQAVSATTKRRQAKQARVARQLQRARSAVEQRRWRKALARAKTVLRRSPTNRSARRIAKLARRRIEHSNKRVSKARRALKKRRWRHARDWATAALRIDPRDRRARKIKRVAQRRLRRSRG